MIEQRSPLVPRDAFPLLTARDIAYLDSAASAQKPKVVLDRMRQFYETSYANIHRAVYPLSEAATEAYESARARVARFLKAPSADSIVFTRNATEAVNLVANSFGARLKSGDRILVTTLEHHANIVPWQLLCDRQGLELHAGADRRATAISFSTRWIACWSASRSWSPSPPPRTPSAPARRSRRSSRAPIGPARSSWSMARRRRRISRST